MTGQGQDSEDAKTCNHELVQRARSGDMSAFEALVERHRDNIYSLGLQMTGSTTKALEIAQQCFLAAHQHLEEFRSEAEFRAWVYRIAATCTLTKVKQRSAALAVDDKLKVPELDERDCLSKYVDWSIAIEKPMSAELRGAIQQTVERLPPKHREVLLSRDLAGLAYEQIAAINGDPVPSIKGRFHEARLSLREAIDRFYRMGGERI